MPALTAPKLLRHLFATALQDGNVDPLIRMDLMGHVPQNGDRAGTPLSMTGHYTHTVHGQKVVHLRQKTGADFFERGLAGVT